MNDNVYIERPKIPNAIDNYLRWCETHDYSVQEMLTDHEPYTKSNDEVRQYLRDNQNQKVISIAYVSKLWSVPSGEFYARLKGAKGLDQVDVPTYLMQKVEENDVRFSLIWTKAQSPDKMTKKKWEELGITEETVDFEPVWKDN